MTCWVGTSWLRRAWATTVLDALRGAARGADGHVLGQDRARLVERGLAVEPEAEAGDEVGDRLAVVELLEGNHW